MMTYFQISMFTLNHTQTIGNKKKGIFLKHLNLYTYEHTTHKQNFILNM